MNKNTNIDPRITEVALATGVGLRCAERWMQSRVDYRNANPQFANRYEYANTKISSVGKNLRFIEEVTDGMMRALSDGTIDEFVTATIHDMRAAITEASALNQELYEKITGHIAERESNSFIANSTADFVDMMVEHPIV